MYGDKMEVSPGMASRHPHPGGSRGSERREDCSCILCEDHRRHANDPQHEHEGDIKYSGEIKVKTKRNKDLNAQHKPRKRKQSGKMHYQSEISQDSEETGIRMKIKMTFPPVKESACHAVTDSSYGNRTLSVMSSPGEKGPPGKRKSSQSVDSDNSRLSPGEVGKRRRKASEFVEWGPIQSNVDGEPQSIWAWKLPQTILFYILDLAARSVGAIPLLPR